MNEPEDTGADAGLIDSRLIDYALRLPRGLARGPAQRC